MSHSLPVQWAAHTWRATGVDGGRWTAVATTIRSATAASFSSASRRVGFSSASSRVGECTRTFCSFPFVRTVRTSAAASSSLPDARVAVGAEETSESYLEAAARPSRFEESCWGPEEITEVLLQAMRVQWSHGYPHTPRGYPRLTHGFHEYPAGMQAAAADRILDVMPGDSVFDPFMGSGTSLVVAMTKGRAAYGVDVSPLAAFVAAHRTWRPQDIDGTLAAMRAAATATVEGLDAAADDLLAAGAEESKAAADAGEGSRDATARGRGASPNGSGAGAGAGAVPRDWRPVQSALACHIDGTQLTETMEEGAVGALWFCLSVALQRSQKGRGKKQRRPYKKQRKKAAAKVVEGGATDSQVEAAESFVKAVDEYCDRIAELSNAVPQGTPLAVTYNQDVRTLRLDCLVDAVLTSPPYPGVYDYLSFARKVRAGSGTATAVGDGEAGEKADTRVGNGAASVIIPGSGTYFQTTVPADRSWPSQWTEGEIGARKALRSDPYTFKEVWQREQEGWLGVVAASLKPGGRAAVMVGDGANIKTQESILEAAKTVGLRGLAGVTMALTHSMEDGRVWNAARKEHLVLLEKVGDAQ